MMEQLPLNVIAHEENKPVTDLVFWYEFQLGRFLLMVLAEEPKDYVYPMALVRPNDGMIFHLLNMPLTILGSLAQEEELTEEAKATIEGLREKN